MRSTPSACEGISSVLSRTVQPGKPQTILRRHRLGRSPVRRLYPRSHRIDIQVDGCVLGSVDVQLLDNR